MSPTTWVFHPNKGDIPGPIREGDRIRLTVGPDLTGNLRAFEQKKDLAMALGARAGSSHGAVGWYWNLVRGVQPGHRVVVSGVGEPDTVCVGEVIRRYQFDGSESPYSRHGLTVQWTRTDINLGKLQPDLGKQLEVSSNGGFLKRLSDELSERIAAVVARGVDPGRPGTPERKRFSFLESAANAVGGVPVEVRIGELLGYWGFQRRSSMALSSVLDDLADFGLATDPHIIGGGIDSRVRLILPDQGALAAGTSGGTWQARPGSLALQVGAAAVPSEPITIDMTLKKALHIMVEQAYSQLAVIDNAGVFIGAVTSDSVLGALVGRDDPELIDALDRRAPCLHRHDHLLDQIGLIRQYRFAFVHSPDGRHVDGIVTLADLTANFVDFISPIVKLEEIEFRLRKVLETIKLSDIRRGLAEPRKKKVKRVADLTLGEFERVLEIESCWVQLPSRLREQEGFLDRLSTVVWIRNSLAHYAPDPLTDELLKALDMMLRLLPPARV